MLSEKANTKSAVKIVIVGAGAAGIAAATKLLELGFENVLIVEGENRIGGRIHTIPFADNVVDLGAQWCHGEKDNVVYELVQDLNMLDSCGPISEDYICIRSNREILSDKDSEILKKISFTLMEERQKGLLEYDGSLGLYLNENFYGTLSQQNPAIDQAIAREFFDNYKKFECSHEGSDTIYEVSGKGNLEYWTCEGEPRLNWKDKGFQEFLKVLTKSTDDDGLGILKDRIVFNQRIEKIKWDTDRCVLISENGEKIEADHIICTVSLGVLKAKHTRMFAPLLPRQKYLAIEGLKLGTVNKFFLEFDEPFGPVEWSAFAFLWREEDLSKIRNTDLFWVESIFGFSRVSYQPRILGGWIIGYHGRHMETLSEEEVLSGIMWLFKKFLKFPIPEPVNFKRTQWYSNPNFRGSYTFRSIYTEELKVNAQDLAAPITNANGKPVLQFAGEATSTHYYSTVHGAVESGWREARLLDDYYT